MLTHDKEYLSKQLTETTKRCHLAEEKAQFLEHQLEETKRSREELYEKLLVSKDTHRTEFQSKLQEELELMRARTSSEVEQLKRQAKEVYERENRWGLVMWSPVYVHTRTRPHIHTHTHTHTYSGIVALKELLKCLACVCPPPLPCAGHWWREGMQLALSVTERSRGRRMQ